MSYNEVKVFLTNPDGGLNKQPVATPQMALDAGLPRDAEGKREWKHGLFGCAEDPVTCSYYSHHSLRSELTP
jgi:hypothetical protein